MIPQEQVDLTKEILEGLSDVIFQMEEKSKKYTTLSSKQKIDAVLAATMMFKDAIQHSHSQVTELKSGGLLSAIEKLVSRMRKGKKDSPYNQT